MLKRTLTSVVAHVQGAWSGFTRRLPLSAVIAALVVAGTFYVAVNSLEWSSREFVHSGYRILSAGLLLLAAASWRKRWVTGAVWVLLVASFGINRVHFDLFGARVSMGGLYSMLETDGREASEFLYLVPWWSWAVTVGFGVLSAAALWWLHRTRVHAVSASGSWVLMLLVPFSVAFQREGLPAHFAENPLAISANIYKGVPLLGDAVLTAAYYREKDGLDDLQSTTRPEFLVRPNAFEGPQILTVAIGESSSRHHWSLYGYGVDTTPNLDRLASEPNFVSLTNAVSPSALTRESLKRVLTFGTVDDVSAYREHWNVVDMARAAGYATVWISNQASVGSDDTVIGAIAHLADEQYFISHELGGDKLDIQLARRYEEVLDRYRDRKVFVILHMIGSHYKYSARSDDEDKAYIAGRGSAHADYDATIHHTDRTLGRVIESTRTDGRTAAVVFFSDHGEEVERGSHGAPEMTRHQVDVPLFVWLDRTATAERVMTNLSRHRAEPFSLEDSIYLIGDLMGWEYSEGVERVISHAEFVPTTPKLLKVDGGTTLYTNELRLTFAQTPVERPIVQVNTP